MNKNYIRKSLTPEFEQIFKKQHPFWDAFVQYKLSEDSEEQKKRKKKECKKIEALPSSWARRLFGGSSEMAKELTTLLQKNLIEAGETD